jgi:hypothetical protein
VIGVIGASGEVGQHVAHLLTAQGVGPLRLGGRNPEAAQFRLRSPLPDAQWIRVDNDDPDSLDAFVRDCDIVVDCAGPSYRMASQVARAAQAAGIHHVDAGSDPVLEAQAGQAAESAVVFAAGALPGLSGLLPRWLADIFDTVNDLSMYTGVLDRFTSAGADDYLAGVFGEGSEPLAAWQNGGPRSGMLTRQNQVALPFFSRDLTLLPYLDGEGQAVARSISLVNGRWYIALDGEYLPDALSAAVLPDRVAAVRTLCRASALDTAGRQPYVKFLVQLDGHISGMPATRTALLQAPGIAALTGSVTAAVTIALIHNQVPLGVNSAAALPDPVTVVEVLKAIADCELSLFDKSIAELADVVGGEI